MKIYKKDKRFKYEKDGIIYKLFVDEKLDSLHFFSFLCI